jgi:hypothetical protein
VGVISVKLMATAGTLAAAAVGLPVAHAGRANAPAPLRVGVDGVALAADAVVAPAIAEVVVPQRTGALVAERTGSPAAARRIRLTVTRAADGATLFTGTLATFERLPVSAGERLTVHVERSGATHGLRASATLAWS